MPSAASSPSMPWASPPPPPVIPRCAASPKSAMLQARRRQCWNRLPQMLEPAKGVLQPQATMLEPAFVFAGTSSNLCYNHLLILLEAAQFLLPSGFFFFFDFAGTAPTSFLQLLSFRFAGTGLCFCYHRMFDLAGNIPFLFFKPLSFWFLLEPASFATTVF